MQSLASRENKMSNYDAGILAAGKALVRRISTAICNERATPSAAKRTSQSAQVIFSRCLSVRVAIGIHLRHTAAHADTQTPIVRPRCAGIPP
jgi:hypothetical protein